MHNTSTPLSDPEIKGKIKNFVAESRTSDAIALLLEMSQSNKQLHESIHILLGEYNELTSQRLRGTIESSEVTRRFNTIHDRILIALDSFDSNGIPLPSSNYTYSGRTTKFLLKLGLIIVGIALGIVIIPLTIFYIFNESLKGVFGEDGKGLLIFFIAAYYIGTGGLIVLGTWLISLFVNALKER